MGMGMKQVALLWTFAASICVLGVAGFELHMDDDHQPGARGGGGSSFLMHDSKLVVKTSAGQMSVVRGLGRLQMQTSMHIGFISMDPNSLFVPQYMDSNLILFVHQGQAKVGSICCKDKLVETGLSEGDLYRIPAGSAFYILNKHSETLHIVCSIDLSESLGGAPFQAFSIGGGTFPKSVLAGFSHNALTSAFNVSMEQLEKIMTRQDKGPIISLSDPATVWFETKEAERIKQLKKAIQLEEQDDDDESADRSWSWRKLLSSVFGQVEKPKRSKHSQHVINLYDREPDFQNDYGWSVSIDQKHYWPLKRSGIGIYFVSLSAGSMLAPHVNPTATEYGIVLKGTGSIQIVFPNGTSALDAKIKPGDVFWVPRYFPFCQIASADEPLEFFGFTTSSHANKPRFLAGSGSVLQTLRGPEIAAAFGVSLRTLESIINAQTQSVILPVSNSAEPRIAEA